MTAAAAFSHPHCHTNFLSHWFNSERHLHGPHAGIGECTLQPSDASLLHEPSRAPLDANCRARCAEQGEPREKKKKEIAMTLDRRNRWHATELDPFTKPQPAPHPIIVLR